MSRAWRIQYDGALYHVLSRGNEGRAIFQDDTDRLKCLDTVGEMSDRFDIDIFSYVLMQNHYHLLLRTNRANLSKAMQWFGATYTTRFNVRHHRYGHLFQGRYKSILVQNDAYLLQLSCYIHCNPLRARIVEQLEEYPWSSYPCYALKASAPEWLSTSLILSQFRAVDKYKAYRRKVQRYSGEQREVSDDFHLGIIFGSKAFAKKICRSYLPEKPDDELPQQKQAAGSLDMSKLLKKAAIILDFDFDHIRQCSRTPSPEKNNRDIMVYLLWKTGLFTNKKIGEAIGLTYSAVSHIVKNVEQKLNKDPEFLERYKTLNSSLFKI